jgi:hypothetical protein
MIYMYIKAYLQCADVAICELAAAKRTIVWKLTCAPRIVVWLQLIVMKSFEDPPVGIVPILVRYRLSFSTTFIPQLK